MKLLSKFKGFREIKGFDNHWEILLSRLFFPRTGIVTYRRGNIEVIVDHLGGDATGTRMCLVSDMYSRYIRDMVVSEKLNVLDIGANGGGFPLRLLLDGYSMQQLTCVEMNPNTFARLQLNLYRNLALEPCLINGAIFGKKTSLKISLGRGSTGDSITAKEKTERRLNEVERVVQAQTFDDIFATGFGDNLVDICKMDVEGAEYDVFSNFWYESLKKCRYLLIEIHDRKGFAKEQVIKAIEALEFQNITKSRSGHPDVYCFENKPLRESTPVDRAVCGII